MSCDDLSTCQMYAMKTHSLNKPIRELDLCVSRERTMIKYTVIKYMLQIQDYAIYAQQPVVHAD